VFFEKNQSRCALWLISKPVHGMAAPWYSRGIRDKAYQISSSTLSINPDLYETAAMYS
jgi:hypothetical protein